MKNHWLLDNGHGGIDTKGKYVTCPNYDVNDPRTFHKMYVHPDGTTLFEGEFNRNVVDLIAYKLWKLGINYTILVPEFKDVSLRTRVQRANDHYARDKSCVFLSVHGNAFNTSAHGLEVFTSKGQTKSDPVAEAFVEEAEKMFPNRAIRTDLTDGDKDKEANFYVLTKTKCRALLTESFFFDMLENAKFMLSDEGLDMIAQYHVNAIIRAENDQI